MSVDGSDIVFDCDVPNIGFNSPKRAALVSTRSACPRLHRLVKKPIELADLPFDHRHKTGLTLSDEPASDGSNRRAFERPADSRERITTINRLLPSLSTKRRQPTNRVSLGTERAARFGKGFHAAA
jgi:hypothetical protein